MKSKQLQTLKDQNKRYVDALDKRITEPDIGCHIVHALVRGENVPILSCVKISNSAREKVAACNRYDSNRTLDFAQVFATPASFKKAQREYGVAKAAADKVLLKYIREADAILLKAELNDGADPEEVSATLRLLAIKHGADV